MVHFPISVSIETSIGRVQLSLDSKKVLIIAGPNGTGKSALLAELYRNIGQDTATYLPGHRQIQFNSSWDVTGMGADQLLAQLFSHVDHFSRYKNTWAEEQFKSELRTLQYKEAEYERDFRGRVQVRQRFILETDSIKDSPIDRVNDVFLQANLPVRFVLTDKGVSAQRGTSAPYSIEALSDGERAALYIVATFINRRSGAVLLIDEPEKHLDQSISSLLLEACIRLRNDIAVVFSTHDPRLIDRISDKDLFHVRNSEVISHKPERRKYDVSAIYSQDESLESLKKDLMGVRSQVLFIEGQSTSLDIPLYSRVFSDAKVIPKGEFQSVCNATRGVSRLVDGHWLEPRGLVDRDGRNDDEVSALERDSIYVLPFPTVENLLFIPAAVDCFVTADMTYQGGKSYDERIQGFKDEVVKSAMDAREDIVAKRVSWRVSRALSESKISERCIKNGFRDPVVISVSEIYEEVAGEVSSVIESEDYEKILRELPIKQTSIPARACKSLGANSFKDYVRVIMRSIDLAEPDGVHFVETLRRTLPPIFIRERPRIP